MWPPLISDKEPQFADAETSVRRTWRSDYTNSASLPIVTRYLKNNRFCLICGDLVKDTFNMLLCRLQFCLIIFMDFEDPIFEFWGIWLVWAGGRVSWPGGGPGGRVHAGGFSGRRLSLFFSLYLSLFLSLYVNDTVVVWSSRTAELSSSLGTLRYFAGCWNANC